MKLESGESTQATSPHTEQGSRGWVLGVLAFASILILWEVLARCSGWSSHIFPDPITVVLSLIDLIQNGTLLRHTVASLFRVTAGFYLAVLLGVPIGIMLGRSWSMRSFMNPVIQFLRPISPLAWIPLAMLWFGIGDLPAVFLIFLASFFPLVVSTTIAVHNINPIFFQVAANFKFSRKERLTQLILPAVIPEVVTALRLTVTIAWLVVVAAEMIAVQSGLGYLILDSRNALRMDYVMDGMIVIGLIGLLLDHIMKCLGKIESASWGVKAR
ncbi:MAG: ABC transporter permease [Desulfobacteraceae bacterium]|nr:MAG: ABC transporter permease [Desulfobacteraceae bacterium]